jgi:uncharacterized membrane protein
VYTFVLTLHVLAAVLIIGPFALAAFSGHRAIRRDDAGDTRDAARFMARFGAGSLLVAVLGIGALASSDRYTFRTPWVIISLTLYVVAMGVATGYTVPAMRKAAALIEASAGRSAVPVAPVAPVAAEPPAPIAGEGDTDDDAAPEPAGFGSANARADTGADTAAEVAAASAATRERLNGIAGRVIGSGALVLVLVALITILMVTRPFGR